MMGTYLPALAGGQSWFNRLVGNFSSVNRWRLDVILGEDTSRQAKRSGPGAPDDPAHPCMKLFEQEVSNLSLAKKWHGARVALQ